MKKILNAFTRVFVRLRYPVSMPEEVASDLGLSISNSLNFTQLIDYLTDPHHSPTKLARFMPRDQAEKIFKSALRKERFQQNSLFSYYFNGSWMEFILQFDEEARLRRLYICHKNLKQKHEILISQ